MSVDYLSSLSSLSSLCNTYRCLNIEYPKTSNEHNFDYLLKQINDLNTINLVGKILYNIKIITNTEGMDYITPKEFLASYMISNNPDEIFNKIDTQEKELINTSNSMLSLFQQIISGLSISNNNHNNQVLIISELANRMKTFQIQFKAFREQDKEVLISVLLQSYYELSETHKVLDGKLRDGKASETEVAWHTAIPHQLGKVMEKICALDPQNGKQRIDNYVPPIADVQSAQEVMKIAQKAYMDVLKEQLNSEPKNYTMFFKCFDEIKMKLKGLTPNRPDLHKIMDEVIDVEFVGQMISNNAYSLDEYHKLVHFIIDKIETLQAPSEDEDTRLWRGLINNAINSGYDFAVFSAEFLLKCFEKIEGIEKTLVALAEAQKKNNN